MVSPQERIEELEAENAWLKGEGIEALARVKKKWRLTNLQARLLLMLARRPQLSREQIHAGLYGDKPDDKQADLKIIDVLVCKIRREEQIIIETVWGLGYRLNALTRAQIMEVAGEPQSSANGGKA